MTYITDYSQIDFKGLSANTVQSLIDSKLFEYDRRNREIREQEARRAQNGRRNSVLANLKKLGFTPSTQNSSRYADTTLSLGSWEDKEGYYSVSISAPRWEKDPAKRQDYIQKGINRIRLSGVFDLRVNIRIQSENVYDKTDWKVIGKKDVVVTSYSIRKKQTDNA